MGVGFSFLLETIEFYEWFRIRNARKISVGSDVGFPLVKLGQGSETIEANVARTQAYDLQQSDFTVDANSEYHGSSVFIKLIEILCLVP